MASCPFRHPYAEGGAPDVRSRSGFGFLFHELLVVSRVEERVDLGVRRELDFHEPAVAVRVFVHGPRLVGEDLVHFEDLARNGQEELGNGLYGFDRAELLAGVEDLAHVGHFDEHDIPELLLGVVADPIRASVCSGGRPGKRSYSSPETLRSFSCRTASARRSPARTARARRSRAACRVSVSY